MSGVRRRTKSMGGKINREGRKRLGFQEQTDEREQAGRDKDNEKIIDDCG